MLIHRFQVDKISFNPNPIFVTKLRTANFSGLFLDSPSGVSIFYCQETMSTIAYELEKDRYLALVDRVKATDMKKYQNRKLTDLQLLWILPG
jgi:hypothetical protein